MLDSVFTTTASTVTAGTFLLCVACSLVLGLLLAAAYMFRSRYTKSFVATVAMLPAVVCVVIMMVNGNIGAGVAVAGVFGLVRFRSVPGTAKEIGIIFLAMGAGLIAGMGYLGYATLFTVVMCAVMLLYNTLDFGTKKNAALYKTLRVTIPEVSAVRPRVGAESGQDHEHGQPLPADLRYYPPGRQCGKSAHRRAAQAQRQSRDHGLQAGDDFYRTVSC